MPNSRFSHHKRLQNHQGAQDFSSWHHSKFSWFRFTSDNHQGTKDCVLVSLEVSRDSDIRREQSRRSELWNVNIFSRSLFEAFDSIRSNFIPRHFKQRDFQNGKRTKRLCLTLLRAPIPIREPLALLFPYLITTGSEEG